MCILAGKTEQANGNKVVIGDNRWGRVLGEVGGMVSTILLYFSDYKTHSPPPPIWDENGSASYSLNVAYLARWWGRGGGSGEWGDVGRAGSLAVAGVG